MREASKALFLGESSNNTTALTFASRDLSYAYSLAGDLDRAEDWAKRSLTYLRQSTTRNRRDILVAVHKVLGDVSVRRNDFESALKHYQTALGESFSKDEVPLKLSLANTELRRGRIDAAQGILKDIGLDDSRWVPFVLRAKGQFAFAKGNYAKAAEHFGMAAARFRQDNDSYHLMWMQHGLAQAYLAAGDRDKAFSAFRDAITSATQLRTEFRSDEFKAGFFGDVQRIFDDAIEMLVDDRRFVEALAISEESRARALLDLLKGKGADPKLDTMQAVATMPPRTAAVVYHVLRNRTIVWTVRAGVTQAAVIPVGQKELSVLVARYRRAVLHSASDMRVQASMLYDMLIRPLGLQPGEAMIVVPHKALHYLPLQALVGSQGYLIEERAVGTMPSLNAMVAIAKDGARTEAVLFALGNPDLGDPVLALPGAEKEVKIIGSLYPGANIFVRSEASKSRFISQAPGKGLIHVAAHATVDEIDPLYSAILLARAEQARGELEAREILQLDLSSARLVTLSACESGLGKVSDGDEFFGFKRTFLAAGAQSLLVSLWAVEDESTANLMATFYRELGDHPMLEALRQAQLTLLKSTARSAPVFWAPFILVGDWR